MGRLASSIPKAKGMSSNGSNFLTIDRYAKNKPSIIIIKSAIFMLSKPIVLRKSSTFSPIVIYFAPLPNNLSKKGELLQYP
jgi:hypothetical protein